MRKNKLLKIKYLKIFKILQHRVYPPNFNNNLIWNIGHILVTQQLLCYRKI